MPEALRYMSYANVNPQNPACNQTGIHTINILFPGTGLLGPCLQQVLEFLRINWLDQVKIDARFFRALSSLLRESDKYEWTRFIEITSPETSSVEPRRLLTETTRQAAC
jgi:hypothetical protein